VPSGYTVQTPDGQPIHDPEDGGCDEPPWQKCAGCGEAVHLNDVWYTGGRRYVVGYGWHVTFDTFHGPGWRFECSPLGAPAWHRLTADNYRLYHELLEDPSDAVFGPMVQTFSYRYATGPERVTPWCPNCYEEPTP
jgi:hypothetical protein